MMMHVAPAVADQTWRKEKERERERLYLLRIARDSAQTLINLWSS